MQSNNHIEIVVVTHDSAAVLPACLAGAKAAGLPVTVVDNASSDATPEIAAEHGATVLRNSKNEGFGRAHNRGVGASSAPYCLLLNPDIAFEAEAPGRLVAALDANPDAVLAAPALVEPDGRVFELGASPINPPAASGVGVVSGAALLVRREAFLKLGGFDPNIFLFWEDNDLCRRITDSGGRLLHVADAKMRHARGGSSAPAPGRIYRAR